MLLVKRQEVTLSIFWAPAMCVWRLFWGAGDPKTRVMSRVNLTHYLTHTMCNSAQKLQHSMTTLTVHLLENEKKK